MLKLNLAKQKVVAASHAQLIAILAVAIVVVAQLVLRHAKKLTALLKIAARTAQSANGVFGLRLVHHATNQPEFPYKKTSGIPPGVFYFDKKNIKKLWKKYSLIGRKV